MSNPTFVVPKVLDDASSNLQLVLPSFELTIDASNAVFAGFTASINEYLHVMLTSSAASLNTAFQLFTEDTDLIGDTNTLDLQFRYVTPAGGDSSLFQSFADSKVVDGISENILLNGPIDLTTTHSIAATALNTTSFLDAHTSGADLSANKVTLADEYINYIAYALFNNTQGMDLLSNVVSVVDDLNAKADTALVNKLVPLKTGGALGDNVYDKSQNGVTITSHPAEMILAQIQQYQPTRLQTLEVTTDANWYKNFLIAGDILSFDVTVNIPSGQNLTGNANPANRAVDSTGAISARRYTVDVHITA